MPIRKRDGLAVSILTLVTLGIYSLFFWYKYGRDVHRICKDDGKYTTNFIVVLLLSIITLGIYYIYWIYQMAGRLETAHRRYHLPRLSPVMFTLVMYVPVLNFLYACDILNELARVYNRTLPGYVPPSEPGPTSEEQNISQQLKSSLFAMGHSIKENVSAPAQYCPKCQSRLPAKSAYCSKCGAKIDSP